MQHSTCQKCKCLTWLAEDQGGGGYCRQLMPRGIWYSRHQWRDIRQIRRPVENRCLLYQVRNTTLHGLSPMIRKNRKNTGRHTSKQTVVSLSKPGHSARACRGREPRILGTDSKKAKGNCRGIQRRDQRNELDRAGNGSFTRHRRTMF